MRYVDTEAIEEGIPDLLSQGEVVEVVGDVPGITLLPRNSS